MRQKLTMSYLGRMAALVCGSGALFAGACSGRQLQAVFHGMKPQ